jgi:hypothetical protein
MITLGIKTYEETAMVAAANGVTHSSHLSDLIVAAWASPSYGSLVRRAKEWALDNPVPEDDVMAFVKSLSPQQRETIVKVLSEIGEEMGNAEESETENPSQPYDSSS